MGQVLVVAVMEQVQVQVLVVAVMGPALVVLEIQAPVHMVVVQVV